MTNHKPWTVLARRFIYRSDWINVQQIDLRLPDGKILRDIHLADYPYAASGVVPIGEDGRILLIDHYRFQTDTRGWEIPAGKIDAGETAARAAARELREETGHRAQSVRELGKYFPANGSSNLAFHIFIARGVSRVGEIEDTNEVIGWRWFTPRAVRGLIAQNKISDGLSLTGLLWAIVQNEI